MRVLPGSGNRMARRRWHGVTLGVAALVAASSTAVASASSTQETEATSTSESWPLRLSTEMGLELTPAIDGGVYAQEMGSGYRKYSVSANAEVRWSSPTDQSAPPGTGTTDDAAGNLYTLSNDPLDNQKTELHSYTREGVLRWAVPAAPAGNGAGGAGREGHPVPVLGADGNIYLLEWTEESGFSMRRFNPETGATLGSWDVPVRGGWVLLLRALRDRLVIVDEGSLEHYRYDGQLLRRVSIEADVPLTTGAVTPDGTAFLIGQRNDSWNQTCSRQLVSVTPTGEMQKTALDCTWTGTDRLHLQPTPDQRVVLDVGPDGKHGSGWMKLDRSGTALWHRQADLRAEAVYEPQGLYGPPAVSEDGTVVGLVSAREPCDYWAGCVHTGIAVLDGTTGQPVAGTSWLGDEQSVVANATLALQEGRVYVGAEFNRLVEGDWERGAYVLVLDEPNVKRDSRHHLLHPLAAQTDSQPPPNNVPSSYYVALGDSFSAGEGAPARLSGELTYMTGTATETNQCHRSLAAYPALIKLSNFPNESYTFRACSGAVTADFFDAPSSDRKREGEPPQLEWLGENTKIVTFSIGGNDIGFNQLATSCVMLACFSQEQQDALRYRFFVLDKLTLPKTFSAVKEKLRNAGARVLVVGYPQILPDPETVDTSRCRSLRFGTKGGLRGLAEVDPEEIRYLRSVVDELNATVERHATAAGFEFIAATAAGSPFIGRELCTSRPVFNGIIEDRLVESFHPNRTGQDAYAELIRARLS